MASYRKRGNGWQFCVRKGKYKNKPLYKTFQKKALGERWAREIEAEIDAGAFKDTRKASKIYLHTLLARYARDIIPTRKASSHSADRARIGTLSRLLGDYTLGGLTSEDVIEYVDERLVEVVSDSIRKELQILADLIDTAHLIWKIYVPVNVVSEARRILKKLRKLKKGNRRDRRLVEDEYERITTAEHTRPTLINQVAAFAVETAMRRGELAAARREHVDRKTRTIRIPETKTDKARTIPLSSLAMRILDELPAQIDGTLFGMRPGSMSQAFRRMVGRLGIDDLTLHDLRHEATSRFFEKGLPIQEVAAITGHEDWRSLKRYTHPDPEQVGRKLG